MEVSTDLRQQHREAVYLIWSSGCKDGEEVMAERPNRLGIGASFVSLVAGVGLLTLGTWIGPTWEGIVFDTIGMASLVALLWLF